MKYLLIRLESRALSLTTTKNSLVITRNLKIISRLQETGMSMSRTQDPIQILRTITTTGMYTNVHGRISRGRTIQMKRWKLKHHPNTFIHWTRKRGDLSYSSHRSKLTKSKKITIQISQCPFLPWSLWLYDWCIRRRCPSEGWPQSCCVESCTWRRLLGIDQTFQICFDERKCRTNHCSHL